MRKITDYIKMLCHALLGFVNNCVDLARKEKAERKKEVARKRQEILDLKKQEEELIKANQINNIEALYSGCFNANFADALNALPDYQKVSSIKIDPLSLRNHFNGNNNWTLSVNIIDGYSYSPSARKQLQEQLQAILDNLYNVCVIAFEDYLTADIYEYQDQMNGINYGQSPLKSDAHFKRDYTNFYRESNRKLYKLQIVDIKPASTALLINYNVDTVFSKVAYYAPENYFALLYSKS